MMNWLLAAPFGSEPIDPWLMRYVPNGDGRFGFRSVVPPYHHDGSRQSTGLSEWRDYWQHSGVVWNQTRRMPEPVGIVTCFPQLATCVGLRKRLGRSSIPLIAWTFNMGRLYSGVRRKVARAALANVDLFAVHSTAEANAYAQWLDLPRERFRFVPLQGPTRTIDFHEDSDDPFLLSMGSAKRDYKLLVDVLAELKIRSVIVSAPHAVEGLRLPSNIEHRSGLTQAQCLELVQRARLSVIPVANQSTASGQVTLLDAMMLARPVIMTRCLANADYVHDGRDACLVAHGSHVELKNAIDLLWQDESARSALGSCARKTAVDRFSDQAVGITLGDILREHART